MVRGGLARKKGITARDVNPTQLRVGTRVEMEHTNDRRKARRIALDHLAEHPNYYTALNRMERRLKLTNRVRKALEPIAGRR